MTDGFRDSGGLTTHRENIEKFNSKFHSSAASGPGGSPAPRANPETTHEEPVRTNCRPQFGPDERPHDFIMTLLPSTFLALTDFNDQKESLDPIMPPSSLNLDPVTTGVGHFNSCRMIAVCWICQCHFAIRLLAKGPTTGNANILVALTRTWELWLLNPTAADVRLTACELFGFGPGKAEEVGLGQAEVHIV